jgi:hypothetical protein
MSMIIQPMPDTSPFVFDVPFYGYSPTTSRFEVQYISGNYNILEEHKRVRSIIYNASFFTLEFRLILIGILDKLVSEIVIKQRLEKIKKMQN